MPGPGPAKGARGTWPAARCQQARARSASGAQSRPRDPGRTGAAHGPHHREAWPPEASRPDLPRPPPGRQAKNARKLRRRVFPGPLGPRHRRGVSPPWPWPRRGSHTHAASNGPGGRRPAPRETGALCHPVLAPGAKRHIVKRRLDWLACLVVHRLCIPRRRRSLGAHVCRTAPETLVSASALMGSPCYGLLVLEHVLIPLHTLKESQMLNIQSSSVMHRSLEMQVFEWPQESVSHVSVVQELPAVPMHESVD